MPRALRRLSASVAAVALALGGVALGAAPAQAADYTPSTTWNIPTAVSWGDTLSWDVPGILAGAPAGTETIAVHAVEWRRVDDGALLATGESYTLPPSTVGSQIYGVFIGTINGGAYDGYGFSMSSNWTGAVAKKQFAQPTLTVAGEAIAGNTLTVAGSWSATPTSYDWEWRRVADNLLVAYGSGTSVGGYTVSSGDVADGSQFYANVTAHLDGYQDATWATSFSQTAHLGSFAGVTAVPAVSGTGRLGTSFSASYDTTGISPAPTSVTIQWRTTDGTLIGTGAMFTPTNALVGQPLYATALLERADYAPYTTLGSAYTATVALADQSPGAAPIITGRNALGGVLTASVDTSGWSPVPDSIDYQWYLEDGTAIAGADQATLAMTAELVGEVVYVVATAHAADHFDYVIASAPTGRVAKPVLGSSAGTVQAGDTVTVEAWGLLLNEEYTVELHSSPVVLGTVTSDGAGTISKSFRIPASTPAGTHTLVLLRGGVAVAQLSVTVAAGPGLAATGADASGAPLGAAALALGLVLVVVSRRPTAGTVVGGGGAKVRNDLRR